MACRRLASPPRLLFAIVGVAQATLGLHGDLIGVSPQASISIALVFLWSEWGLELLFLSRTLGPQVLMLFLMVGDVLHWLMLQMILQLGFSAAFHVYAAARPDAFAPAAADCALWPAAGWRAPTRARTRATVPS